MSWLCRWVPIGASELLTRAATFRPIVRGKKMDRRDEERETVVPKEEVVRFVGECLSSVGASSEDGQTVGHHLMVADYRGHFSHGMNRLHMYVADIETGMTDATAEPEILRDFQAIALVSGRNGLGQVIGKYCMELAMAKAEQFGIGMVASRRSNHYGICGYYTSMAIERGLIGFTCTNTSPLATPTRSSRAALGTNPLSLGMGAADGCDSFLLDMATTTVAFGKIELAMRKRRSIPEGWALGTDGEPTTSAEDAYEAAALLPLGGDERNSGYKGYGLALMVEVLCGILAGSEFGPNIRQWKDKGKVADLGQCFMAIDPEAFGPCSKDRLTKLLGQLRGLPTIGAEPVLIPGDPERAAMNRVDEQGGIAYHPNQLRAAEELARRLAVAPMRQLVPRGQR